MVRVHGRHGPTPEGPAKRLRGWSVSAARRIPRTSPDEIDLAKPEVLASLTASASAPGATAHPLVCRGPEWDKVGRDLFELRVALLRATSLHFEDLVLEMLKQVIRNQYY